MTDELHDYVCYCCDAGCCSECDAPKGCECAKFKHRLFICKDGVQRRRTPEELVLDGLVKAAEDEWS